LFHHPDDLLSKITIQKSPITTIEGTATGIVGLSSHLKILKKLSTIEILNKDK